VEERERGYSFLLSPTPHRPLTHRVVGRCSVVVGILAYYARGREFDSRTVQTFVCMNCLFGLGLSISMYNMYVFTKKKVYKYTLIRYLESITQALQVLTLD
jgi:hypothetical protein